MIDGAISVYSAAEVLSRRRWDRTPHLEGPHDQVQDRETILKGILPSLSLSQHIGDISICQHYTKVPSLTHSSFALRQPIGTETSISQPPDKKTPKSSCSSCLGMMRSSRRPAPNPRTV